MIIAAAEGNKDKMVSALSALGLGSGSESEEEKEALLTLIKYMFRTAEPIEVVKEKRKELKGKMKEEKRRKAEEESTRGKGGGKNKVVPVADGMEVDDITGELRKIIPVWELNQKVEARYKKRRLFYKSTIAKVNGDGTYNILYEDENTEDNVASLDDKVCVCVCVCVSYRFFLSITTGLKGKRKEKWKLRNKF
jgi:hypothetical protein